MPTECSLRTMLFAPVEGRRVVADFAGGAITSDAGRCCWVPPTGRSAWWIGSRPALPMPARRV